MRLSIHLKPEKLICSLLMAFSLNAAITHPLFADSDAQETLGDLSARIEELENQMNGERSKTDDKNPGDHVVTRADLDLLQEEVRALKDARQTPHEDINRLQGELQSLRQDIRQIQRENAMLRSQGRSQKPVPAIADAISDSPNAKPASKSKNEPWSQTQDPSSDRTSSPVLPSEKDEETESILKLLDQSAPGDEEEGAQRSPKTKNSKNKDLETIRETATKQAEDTAPTLPAGNAEARYNEAFALYGKGAYKEAERAFEYFIKTYPSDTLVSQAMYGKAESCLKQGKDKEAKILFVNAYKKNPKGSKAPHCLLKLGGLLAMQGSIEDACTAWLKLKTDFPHMTNEMENELTALKKKYGCEQKAETVSKSASKS